MLEELPEDEVAFELDGPEGLSPEEAARQAALSGECLGNRERFLTLAHEAARGAMAMADRLQAMEERLVLVDRMLRVSQPPKPGKLGVRWWRANGKDTYRRPVLVRWERLRNGRWRSSAVAQVRRDRISREGTAAINAEWTYQLALSASRLIKGYTDTVAALAKGGRDLNRWHAKTDALLGDATTTLRVSHRGVILNLEREGYDVDEATMTLLDGLDPA
jgi:hypothetical protein